MPTKHDFGKGPVPAHRHKNPDGSVGGWVANTAFVAPTATVEATACVFDSAQVLDRVQVKDFANVYEQAIARDEAWLEGKARLFGSATMKDSSRAMESAIIRGEAILEESSSAEHYSQTSGYAKLYGYARALGESRIQDNARIGDGCIIYGAVTGMSHIRGSSIVYPGIEVSCSTGIDRDLNIMANLREGYWGDSYPEPAFILDPAFRKGPITQPTPKLYQIGNKEATLKEWLALAAFGNVDKEYVPYLHLLSKEEDLYIPKTFKDVCSQCWIIFKSWWKTR